MPIVERRSGGNTSLYEFIPQNGMNGVIGVLSINDRNEALFQLVNTAMHQVVMQMPIDVLREMHSVIDAALETYDELTAPVSVPENLGGDES